MLLKRSLKNRVLIFAMGLLFLYAMPIPAQAQQGTLKKSSAYKNINVKVLKSIHLPAGYREGLLISGRDAWVCNGEGGKIWIVDTESGKINTTIEPIAGFTEGVSPSPDGKFFVTDWDEKKVYKARLENNLLKPESWVSVDPAHPAGVVWTGDRLFVITWTRGMGTKFDLLEMDQKMAVLNKVSIQAIEEPAHLAWDGRFLWITSWYDQRVYKVDIKSWEMLSSFHSPAPKTTGIAFDGKYIWLTGTYSDLYKLEIQESEAPMNLIVTSSAFKDGEMIPVKYTCDGDDMSPPLEWAGLPKGTKSIAMISDDPDAPRGTWVHWVIFNMPPDSMGLPEGVPPDKVLDNGAIQGMNDSDQIGYGGPCPPGGVHRYFFKVYALDAKIPLGPGATKLDLEEAMRGHILSQAQIMGRYKR